MSTSEVSSSDFITQATPIFAIIGIIFIILILIKVLVELWYGFKTYIFTKCYQKDLVKTYGPWAVVTGATDGIGKAYSMELAQRGMNICLISRSLDKLQYTAKEIETRFSVATMCIQADFSRSDIYDRIRNELANLDIGLLFNNVGMANEHLEPFVSQSEDFHWKIINVNIGATIMMTSVVLPGMLKRNRGIIVNMSSLSGTFPVPQMSVYSSTKAFVTTFSYCLQRELKNVNVRVQNLDAGWIETNMFAKYTGMIKFNKTFLPGFMPTGQQYAESAVKTISSGNDNTCGYWSQSLFKLITLNCTNKCIRELSTTLMMTFNRK